MFGNLIISGAGLAAQGTSAYVVERLIKGVVRMPKDPVKKAAVLAGSYAISACLSSACAKYIQSELTEGTEAIKGVIQRSKPEEIVETKEVVE